MKYEEIVKQVETLVAECELLRDKYGDKALTLIGDYPLYAGTSNISYGEAILIATVFGHIDRQLESEELLKEYFDTLPKGEMGSLAGYEKWVAERNKK